MRSHNPQAFFSHIKSSMSIYNSIMQRANSHTKRVRKYLYFSNSYVQCLWIVESCKKNSKRVAYPLLCLISIFSNKMERQKERQIEHELKKDIEV